MTLDELTKEMEQLHRHVKRIVDMSEYREYDDLSGIEYDRQSAEDLLLVDEYKGILQKLDDVEYTLAYLKKPVAFEDTLTVNESGRYTTTNGRVTYTSGSGIEFLYQEEIYNSKKEEFEFVPCWRTSRIEHNGECYYIVGYSSVELDGLNVRVRR